MIVPEPACSQSGAISCTTDCASTSQSGTAASTSNSRSSVSRRAALGAASAAASRLADASAPLDAEGKPSSGAARAWVGSVSARGHEVTPLAGADCEASPTSVGSPPPNTRGLTTTMTTISTAKAVKARVGFRVARNAGLRPLDKRVEASDGERREIGAVAGRCVRGGASPAARRVVRLLSSLGGGRRCSGSGRNGLRRLRGERGGSANGVLPATRRSGGQDPLSRRASNGHISGSAGAPVEPRIAESPAPTRSVTSGSLIGVTRSMPTGSEMSTRTA